MAEKGLHEVRHFPIFFNRNLAIRPNKFRISMGLPTYATINCADNTGAKSLMIIAVKGVQGRLNRLPHAAVGDMVMCSVRKGKPDLRKKGLALNVTYYAHSSFHSYACCNCPSAQAVAQT